MFRLIPSPFFKLVQYKTVLMKVKKNVDGQAIYVSIQPLSVTLNGYACGRYISSTWEQLRCYYIEKEE